ncbi:Uncharacterised protein [Bordetella pertussis]|nr:Uncharacterised protein [Bordetella pertussis]CFU00787.1 Uncharacterised protein [Bordetella pertussis]CFW03629.1 Uncharacterised protein [Bordetella pertussis]CFW32061.1 Uncharacterised protein [Bordetella pertussis]
MASLPSMEVSKAASAVAAITPSVTLMNTELDHRPRRAGGAISAT